MKLEELEVLEVIEELEVLEILEILEILDKTRNTRNSRKIMPAKKNNKKVLRRISLPEDSELICFNEKRRLPTLPHCIAVPSAQAGLTSLFGMGRGGTPPLSPPDMGDIYYRLRLLNEE